ncbi:hypothetical protein H8959_001565, partial [Pygathrix nigripes]
MEKTRREKLTFSVFTCKHSCVQQKTKGQNSRPTIHSWCHLQPSGLELFSGPFQNLMNDSKTSFQKSARFVCNFGIRLGIRLQAATCHAVLKCPSAGDKRVSLCHLDLIALEMEIAQFMKTHNTLRSHCSMLCPSSLPGSSVSLPPTLLTSTSAFTQSAPDMGVSHSETVLESQ